MTWHWLTYQNAVTHAVSETLLASHKREARRRGFREDDGSGTLDRLGFSLPGMAIQGEPWEVVRVDGLAISVRGHDFGSVLGELRGLKRRKFADGKQYYKLHGFHRAIVLTAAQRQELERAMSAVVDEVDARATAFWRAA